MTISKNDGNQAERIATEYPAEHITGAYGSPVACMIDYFVNISYQRQQFPFERGGKDFTYSLSVRLNEFQTVKIKGPRKAGHTDGMLKWIWHYNRANKPNNYPHILIDKYRSGKQLKFDFQDIYDESLDEFADIVNITDHNIRGKCFVKAQSAELHVVFIDTFSFMSKDTQRKVNIFVNNFAEECELVTKSSAGRNPKFPVFVYLE